jgi:DNA-binding XRE family transcriptional regulator
VRSPARRGDPSPGKASPLAAGSLVRVIRVKDPWLRRYSGMRARVGHDDGLVVEVLLPCGDLVSFWRDQVEPVAAPTNRGAACQRPASGDVHQILRGHDPVGGASLKARRREAGLTQAAIASAMGVSVPRVSQIEAALAVRIVTATRYLEGLRRARATAA